MPIETVSVNGYRFYLINGKYYPSVTSILKLKPNPALEKWKMKLAEEQVIAISEYTAERGEIIHYSALRTYETETITQDSLNCEYNYFKQYPQMREEILRTGQLFKQFKQQFHLIPVALEKAIWHDTLHYAGRIDFAGYLVQQKNSYHIPILMDIKTSKQMYKDSLALQLAGYNLCIQKKATRLYCLLLHPGSSRVADVAIGHTHPYWSFEEIQPNYEGFLSLLRAFKQLQPKILSGE